MPIALGDDVMTVLMGTLAEEELTSRARGCDALVIMKTGRNLQKVRRALESAGRLDEAWLIERGTMPGERVARLKDVGATECPYFAIVLVHGQGRQMELARMTGMLTIAGLGPGDAALITPEVAAALADATDVVGYAPYVARVAAREGLVLHASDNRQELLRADEAMRLAAAGRRVVVVSSGDPGVFAMASAVFEALEASPQWQGLVDPRLAGRDRDAGRRGACRRAARP